MKVWRYLIIFIINNFMSFTRFFEIKRRLLISAGYKIGKGTRIVGPIYLGSQVNLKIGENCWIGKNLNIDGNGDVCIGDNVDIAPHVTINTGGHQIGDRSRRAGKGLRFKTKIGKGSWIGTNVTIVNGSEIEESVVIAAGSVVISNIKKDTLVAGVPAKVKKELS
ncbi:acyltransferase [Cytobacillus firmus]|uniref:acyltransferase n=1 Tax=Cytobacillus firmus TaxID=1399 RepID=UPI00369BF476